MAPKKLTESDKKSILKLYREPEETTSTLADRYGVSNSTISRLLKASLPQKEYSRLIQQKRSTADKTGSASSKPSVVIPELEIESQPEPTVSTEPPAKVEKPGPVLKKREKPESPAPGETAPEPGESEATNGTVPSTPTKRTRRRAVGESAEPFEEAAQLSLPEPVEEAEPLAPPVKEAPKLKSEQAPVEVEDDDTGDMSADWDDVSNLDDDYDEDDEDDEDFDEEGDAWMGDVGAAPNLEKLEIAPLTDASLPRLCYVVVERASSELVALPLRTFAHLGEIPEAEGDSRTLPVFDNHRVARRFSRRNQRVVKLPDGNLLQTTSPYLMAKGITRLLIDGQVFALEDDDYEEVDADFE